MKLKTRLLIAASVGTLALGANAEESKWYGIAGLGTASISSDLSNFSASSGSSAFTQSVDTNGSAFLAGVGYQYDDLLALEAAYLDVRDFGMKATGTNVVFDGYTVNGSASLNQDVKGTGLMFSAKYDYKLNNDSKLYGRLGFAQIKVTADYSISGSGTINGHSLNGFSLSTSSTKTVPVLGVGYEYAFTKSFALRGEYTYIDKVGDDNTGSSAVNMLTVQTVFKF